MAWTTDDLLTTIKNRAMIPDASSGSFGSAALLGFATEELLLTLVGVILGTREKYYETYSDTALAAGVAVLPIPSRAIGGTLSCVQYLYQNRVSQLLPIDPGTIATTDTALVPSNFYFQNNSIVIYPTPTNATGVVRQRYFQRPNRLEQTINCGQITAVDPVGMTVTVAAAPSTWATGNQMDFIPQTASQATPYGLNSPLTGVTGTTLSFTALPLTSTGAVAPVIGDWVALAEYTPIPEIPFEFQVVLAQMGACSALEAAGDQAGLAAGQAKLGRYLESAGKLLTPRDQQGPKKVVSPWRRF